MTTEPTKRKAGSIRQYATLGKASEHPNTETPRSQDTQELERSNTQESGHPGTETPKRERHTIYFPPDLSEWIKIRAVITKREISEIATEALQRYKDDIEGK